MTGPRDSRAIIQDIVDKLLDGYQPLRVILFGSHAYGQPEPDSDIDLLIIKRRYPFTAEVGLTEDDVRGSLEQLQGLVDRLRAATLS